MQKKRHSADYDPEAMYSPVMVFFKSNIIQDIFAAENVIHRFSKTPLRDRRAFAVYILLDRRD